MKLDHTFIAIRERGIMEICDLALHVARDHFKPLIILLFIGALPWIVVDWLITRWMVSGDFGSDYAGLYYWVMGLLIISQAQVGSTFITYYLGQAMFVGRPGIGESVRGTLKTSPYFIWIHGGLRLVVPILILAGLIDMQQDSLVFLSGLLIPGLVLIALLVRGFRPFVSEMLLLERPPIRSSSANKVNFKRRSWALHGAMGSELFGRMILTSLFFVPLSGSFFFMFVIIDSSLNLRANLETSLFPYYWIAGLWLTVGFAAVVRFLSYVDTRIRQEGWAVELRMRAEGLRVTQAIQ